MSTCFDATSLRLLGPAAALLLGLAGGCSGNTEPAAPPADAGAGAAATGGGGAGGAGQGATGQGGLGFDGGSQGGGGPLDGGCATDTIESEPLPLDMYIMLDQSGSMAGAKWKAVTSALGSFAANPDLADLGVGLQYFPLPEGKICNLEAYAAPEVVIAPLSVSGSAIGESLGKHSPVGETPTLPALQGAIKHAREWATDHPTHTVVVVLATDGEPNVCGSTVENVSQAAKLGATGSPQVRSFVIGVGAALSALNDIASAGGSDKAILVDDTGQKIAEQFAAALDEIRGKALPCEYAIPKPEAGALDFGKVNVVYTPGGGEPGVLPKVGGPDACGESTKGWYYDQPNGPTKVILCPAACDQVKADKKGRVDLVFGCVTQVA
ncbi:MAG: VWA domain-containing protein [Deltaproteobacteria bacterium]|nr:VWA domain-containing protein [Deltaproteobacteria bacterium]